MPFCNLSHVCLPELESEVLKCCNFSVKPPYGPGYGLDIKPPSSMTNEVQPAWQGRSIAGPKIRLVEFSAFLEQQRDADSVGLCFLLSVSENYQVNFSLGGVA